MFAVLGTAILLVVGRSARELPLDDLRRRPSLRDCVVSLAHNRAFVTLNAATLAMIVAATVLGKSVLYYYKYYLGDEAAGIGALAAMGIAGALAVPLWTHACRRFGARALWFAATGIGIALLALFGLYDIRRVAEMNAFLMGMQVALTGLNIAFWSMLPDTIEYGERSTGLRAEGIVFGLAAMLQRVAIGGATGLLGLLLARIGYAANATQTPATLEGMRLTVALVPLGFLALSALLMALNPLTRGTHAAIVAELERRRTGS